jgi:hypothetical protein
VVLTLCSSLSVRTVDTHVDAALWVIAVGVGDRPMPRPLNDPYRPRIEHTELDRLFVTR